MFSWLRLRPTSDGVRKRPFRCHETPDSSDEQDGNHCNCNQRRLNLGLVVHDSRVRGASERGSHQIVTAELDFLRELGRSAWRLLRTYRQGSRRVNHVLQLGQDLRRLLRCD